MWKLRLSSMPVLALVGVMTMANAQAAFEVERSVTLRDSFGGELVSSTIGEVRIPGSNTSTVTTLTNFHPRGENLVVNGDIERQRLRSADEHSTRFNGSLSVTDSSNGSAEAMNISFENLQLSYDGFERELTGTVSVNGQNVDAEEMPRAAARVVMQVLRILRRG